MSVVNWTPHHRRLGEHTKEAIFKAAINDCHAVTQRKKEPGMSHRECSLRDSDR